MVILKEKQMRCRGEKGLPVVVMCHAEHWSESSGSIREATFSDQTFINYSEGAYSMEFVCTILTMSG